MPKWQAAHNVACACSLPAIIIARLLGPADYGLYPLSLTIPLITVLTFFRTAVPMTKILYVVGLIIA